MKNAIARILTTVIGLVLLPVSAGATLVGLNLSAQLETVFPGASVHTQFTFPAVVGSGLEFDGVMQFVGGSAGLGRVILNFDDTILTVTNEQFGGISGIGGTHGLYVTRFTNLHPSIVGIEYVGDSSPNNKPRILFVPEINEAQLVFKNWGVNLVEVFEFQTSPVPIPEPSTLAILGLGLAGLGVMRRRRAT